MTDAHDHTRPTLTDTERIANHRYHHEQYHQCVEMDRDDCIECFLSGQIDALTAENARLAQIEARAKQATILAVGKKLGGPNGIHVADVSHWILTGDTEAKS